MASPTTLHVGHHPQGDCAQGGGGGRLSKVAPPPPAPAQRPTEFDRVASGWALDSVLRKRAPFDCRPPGTMAVSQDARLTSGRSLHRRRAGGGGGHGSADHVSWAQPTPCATWSALLCSAAWPRGLRGGGGGRLSPLLRPPTPSLQGSHVRQPERGWEGLGTGIRGYPPPQYITSKRSPERAERFEARVSGKRILRKFSVRNALRPDFRAILTSTDSL